LLYFFLVFIYLISFLFRPLICTPVASISEVSSILSFHFTQFSLKLYFVLFFSFRKLLTEKLILRLYGGRCCRCVCVGLPWDDATIQALCRRQEFGGAEHGGRVPAAPAERGQRVAPGGHDGRGLPSPGLDAVAAAALRRSRLM
jgi:hypothetical protein